jgi:hypothetical protein
MFSSLISLFLLVLHNTPTKVTPPTVSSYPTGFGGLGTILAMDCTTTGTCKTDGVTRP